MLIRNTESRRVRACEAHEPAVVEQKMKTHKNIFVCNMTTVCDHFRSADGALPVSFARFFTLSLECDTTPVDRAIDAELRLSISSRYHSLPSGYVRIWGASKYV